VPHLEVLESELRKFEIDLPPAKKQLLVRYCDELVHWNKRMNLTGLKGVEMVRRLVVEPVWIGGQLKPKGILADIGSGNGSPAVPLHIVCSFTTAHLIEARVRRAAFLRHLTTTLPLRDLMVHRARLEDVTSELEPVDWITLQGVGLTSELLDSITQIAAATTNIVWISSAQAKLPLTPVHTLCVPHTGTEVFVFRRGDLGTGVIRCQAPKSPN
jgi:16S rRNA (guanine527-N7)-methyltransferase